MDEAFVRDAGLILKTTLLTALLRTLAEPRTILTFINGTGIQMPTGILDATNGADVGITTAEITYDNVIGLYFSVKPVYRRNAVWMMNDETALALRTLKDSAGNYLWRNSDDAILGKRVIISEYMPNAESKDSKPIAFGDFSYYWVICRSPVSQDTLQKVCST